MLQHGFHRIWVPHEELTETNVYFLCVCSCGLNSEAGPAGLTGADPAAQAKGGYSKRCHGGSEPAKAFCHHILWCQWGWKVHQFGQGEIPLLKGDDAYPSFPVSV